MRKTTITMLCLAACFAAADTKITWLADVTADRAETVTGVQSNVIAAAAAHIPRTDNPHGVTAAQVGALTTEVDPVAGPRLDLIEPEMDKWSAAYGWGDHAAVGYLLPADLTPYATTAALAAHTNRTDNPHNVTAPQIGALTEELDPVANAAIVVHTNRTDNPHGVTAPQIGALTAEQDLAALRTYHYGSPDIVESPAGWFNFDGAGTITGFNWAAGRENVVIPWAIGGVPVTAIGEEAFYEAGAEYGLPVTSVIAPKTVTTIEGGAFYYCILLASVSLPQAQTVGDYAFFGCYSLTSINLPQAQTVVDYAFYYCSALTSVVIPQVTSIGEYAFAYCSKLTLINLPQATSIGNSTFSSCSALTAVHMGQNAPAQASYVFTGITPPPNVYVTDPQATGWGAPWNGAPVVRPPLHADAIYQSGKLVATTQHVAEAIAAIPVPDLSDRPTFAQIAASNALPYTAWTGTVTPADGTATVTYAHGNMPVLVVPDGPGTTYVTIATDTYAATSGVSRVSLSIWAGENTIELLTDEVDYATAPDIPTDGWGTILFRRVSDGRWKGVGL